tara:strand:- start:12895 stop:13284 length:390 start_codon:yes stop_codon:yes gene_type:complete
MTYNLNDIDIKVFKLSSGEEVISLVSSVDGDVYKLEFPLEVHKQVRQSTHAFAFSDWQPLGRPDLDVTLSKTHVISVAVAEDEVKERYIRMCLQLKNHYDDVDEDEDVSVSDDQLEEFMTDVAKAKIYH